MSDISTQGIMDPSQEDEIEIFELDDAWLDTAYGGAVINTGCQTGTDYNCVPPP